MTAQITRLGSLLLAIALASGAASASAAPYIPPGNSAATQYTEAVPTAGGPKATGKTRQGKSLAPDEVLGSSNAKRLEAHGPAGDAAAELAAETAPAPVPATNSGTSPGHVAPGQGGAQSPGGSAGAIGAGQSGALAQTQAQSPNGSSGLGEVLGQATGSSSGQPGFLLPLLILGAVIWSIGYLLRHQRKRPAA